jgi:hypothetical protein
MKHPQSSRTACRYANPLTGGAPSGPAKPDPRVPANGLLRGPSNLFCASWVARSAIDH